MFSIQLLWLSLVVLHVFIPYRDPRAVHRSAGVTQCINLPERAELPEGNANLSSPYRDTNAEGIHIFPVASRFLSHLPQAWLNKETQFSIHLSTFATSLVSIIRTVKFGPLAEILSEYFATIYMHRLISGLTHDLYIVS